MKRLDLSKLKWRLYGWEANIWRLSRGAAGQGAPEVGPVPARVPGSVHAALLDAGLIPDWNVGLNSYQCEWVENRHWEFTTQLPLARLKNNEGAVRLVCLGLDHAGSILLDGQVVGEFRGTLRPHVIDLTPHIKRDRRQRLSVVFEGAPAEQNQFGYSSRSRHFKPRYAYKWDWCPRIVPLGAWDALWLEFSDTPRLTNVRPRATLQRGLKTGRLKVECKTWSATKTGARLTARLRSKENVLAETEKTVSVAAGEGRCALSFPALEVAPWQPNGQGAQTLYGLELELRDADGAMLDNWQGRVGFKRQRWLPCEGAPAEALPWLCEINGEKIFLQGANWTPVRAVYQDLKRADYARLLRQYQKLGFNLLRVWGGGLIERRDFYELCDELGLLVWQEFPLSSSGVENAPPDDPQAIAELAEIAASAIERRAGHVSLLQWCGGNELTVASADGKNTHQPADESHPCLQALAAVAKRLDPDRRLLPTSPQGPVFAASPENYGKGMHHNVHGPWKLEGALEDWKAYWDDDDALFRAEFGCPGASPLDILELYKGDCALWPPSEDNPFWRHRGQWWVEWERFKDQLPKSGGRAGVAEYVRLSQELQAEALSYAVRRCKQAFPRCGGVIIWMGHDTFPCAANTSLIDYHARPKPAALALAKIFKTAAK